MFKMGLRWVKLVVVVLVVGGMGHVSVVQAQDPSSRTAVAARPDPGSTTTSTNGTNSTPPLDPSACITIKSSQTCPSWPSITVHPSLRLFSYLRPQPVVTDSAAFDKALEGLADTFQQQFVRQGECDGEDAVRAVDGFRYLRGYWCNEVVMESAKVCGGAGDGNGEEGGEGEQGPTRLCRDVCEAFVKSAEGVRGRCAKGAAFVERLKESVQCETFPTPDEDERCVGLESEERSCGMFLADVFCRECPAGEEVSACRNGNGNGNGEGGVPRVPVTQLEGFSELERVGNPGPNGPNAQGEAAAAAGAGGGLSTLALVGVIVGGCLGILALSALTVIFIKRFSNRPATAVTVQTRHDEKGPGRGVGVPVTGRHDDGTGRGGGVDGSWGGGGGVQGTWVREGEKKTEGQGRGVPMPGLVGGHHPAMGGITNTTNDATQVPSALPAPTSTSTPIPSPIPHCPTQPTCLPAPTTSPPTSIPTPTTPTTTTTTTTTALPTHPAPTSHPLRTSTTTSGTSLSHRTSSLLDPILPPTTTTTTTTTPTSPPSHQTITPTPYITIHPYTHHQPDEIDLVPGDMVTVTTLFDDGWCFGKNDRSGAEGAMPQACLASLGGVGSG